jgi:glycosyltransferase involved in cell wall biosynthesis
MNILIYTDDFAPSIGGVQTITAILAQGLADATTPANGRPAEANEVTVVTRTPAGTMDDGRFGYRVVRFPTTRLLYRLIRRADIVHISGPAILPMAIGYLLRKPVVVEHDGYQAVCPLGNYLHLPDRSLCPGHFQNGEYLECYRCQAVEMSRARSIRNLALMFPRRWLLKRIAANVGASDHTGRRVALPRTQTIYHGIEDSLAAKPAPARATSPVQFAYLGRLIPEKGVDILLRAAAISQKSGRDFRLCIIGDGPQRRALEELAANLSLNRRVEFLGYRTGQQLIEALETVSVSVIPSRWEEACPLTAIEQMMRGLVIIASELGGTAEVVGDAGLKFPVDDADALAAHMSWVIDNPGQIGSLGDAARRRALDVFSREEMMHRHLELYGQFVHAGGTLHE